nr:hypothetical protein [Tanacetum cinerariifolium]
MVEFEKATVKDYTKLVVTREMVDYVLEKYGNNWKCEDEIADVILEDLWLKYGKGDKGKGKVHDIQNKLKSLKWIWPGQLRQSRKIMIKERESSLMMLILMIMIMAKETKNAKLAKEAELKAKDAMLAEVVQVSSDEDYSSDEAFFGDEDVVMFNVVKYPLIDAEIRMLKERPTTSRALTAFTSTRSKAFIAFTSNAQAASTLAPRGYRKIAVTGCILGLRAPNDPNAPPPSATRKRKSKKYPCSDVLYVDVQKHFTYDHLCI